MNKKQIHQPALIFFKGLAIFMLFNIFGCAPVYDEPVTPVKQIDYDNGELEILKTGYDAFQNNEFEKAAQIFEQLHQTSENETIQNNALFGLGFTRLMMVETTQNFNQSIRLLNSWWYQIFSADLGAEGPRLFRNTLIDLKENEVFQREFEKEEQEKLMKKKEQEHEKLMKKKESEIRQKEKNIKTLNSKIRRMQKEIKTLKNQIESLEAIHQQIQEKKKEISAP